MSERPEKPQQCTHPATQRIGNSNLEKCTRCGKVRYKDFDKKNER